jgi:hypothetical protein
MKLNKTMKTSISLAAIALVSTPVQAAITALTSVDQLDFTNVVKAYDFTGTSSIADNGATFDIGGVTFTRARWNDGNPGTTIDGMTLNNVNTSDNQGSNAPNIALGGTATDRTNLNELLDVWNIGNNPPMNISVALANGTYEIQYLVGVSGNRDNEVFNTTDGANVSLGAWSSHTPSTGNMNYLITGEIVVTSGTLSLSVDEGTVAGGDNRPVVSGLIISQIPEPSTTALLGLGGLALILRRRK